MEKSYIRNSKSCTEDKVNDILFNFQIASWYAVALSCGAWTLLYFCVRYTCDTKSPEWCNRIITLIHGLVIAISGLQQCHKDSEWVFHRPEDESTPEQMLIIVTSLGYFAFDLVWCLAYDTESNLMIFHHTYSCIALYRVILSGVTGGPTACGLGVMEATNPFLQWRWFLRSEGYFNTLIFYCVELTFLSLFFLLRIVLGTYAFYKGVFVYNYSFECKILGTIIYVMSWVFFGNIIKFVYMKYIDHSIPYLKKGMSSPVIR